MSSYTERSRTLRVLLSAAGSPAAASLLRHLKNLGYYVIGIDSNKALIPLGNKFCDEFYVSPEVGSYEYLGFIVNLLSSVDIFLPFIDEELILLSKYNENSDRKLPVMLSDYASISLCCDKIAFQEFCEQHDLPIAKSTNNVPCIWKPRFGRGSKGVSMVSNLNQKLSFLEKEGVFQEFLSGKEYTVDCFFSKQGELVSVTPRERVLANSVSVVGRVVQDPEVEAFVKHILKSFSFRGLINVQLMATTNGLFLIEINPRLAGSIIFSVVAGADYIRAAIENWVFGMQPMELTAKEATFYRYWQEYAVISDEE